MTFDRSLYFDAVRASLFSGGMSQQQVDGQNAILDGWEHSTELWDIRWLAYMLATTFHETAATMWPIEEYGKGAGKSYGKPDPKTGQTYYGRGFVQLTWDTNYQKATQKLFLTGDRNIYLHAAKALDLDIAAAVMFRGMTEGWFRQKDGKPETLGRYFNDTVDDPVNARGIINGDVSKMGKQVAGYHQKFLAALSEAVVWPEPDPAPDPDPAPGDVVDVLVNVQCSPGLTFAVFVNGEQVV